MLKSTYYSCLMLNAFWYPLFLKLCRHNPPNPNQVRLAGVRRPLQNAPISHHIMGRPVTCWAYYNGLEGHSASESIAGVGRVRDGSGQEQVHGGSVAVGRNGFSPKWSIIW